MNVFSSVYLTVFLYVFLAVYLAVFLYVYPTVILAVFFEHIHNRHGAVTAASRLPNFAGAGAGSLLTSPRCPYGKFGVRQHKRRQTAKFNQIRSARLNSGVQRQLVQARLGCALKCHGRSRGNSGAATSK
jgi:hypothetical protein